MLEVQLKKTFPGATAPFELDVSFRTEPGISVLFGPSGSGKTTILGSVAGVLRPDAGQVTADGVCFFDAGKGVNLSIRRRQVGYLFQSLALFPHLTVFGNVAYGLGGITFRGSKRAERRARVEGQLHKLRIAHLSDRYPRQISGGQQQRVALARALVNHPRVLLLDEPLSGLDLPVKQEILTDLREGVKSLRIPVLYVTHDAQEAARVGERLLVLENGRIVQSGDPVTVMKSPARETVARLADVGNILQVRLTEKNTEKFTQTVEADRCRLRIPLTRHAVGSTLRLAVPAGDILVATEKPRSISARNILQGKVTSIERRDPQVRLMVNCGTILEVRLTPQAVEELELQLGKPVWLVIKAYSCHILEE